MKHKNTVFVYFFVHFAYCNKFRHVLYGMFLWGNSILWYSRTWIKKVILEIAINIPNLEAHTLLCK